MLKIFRVELGEAMRPLYDTLYELFDAYQPWAKDAACKGSDIHILPDVERADPEKLRERRQAVEDAKRVCEACPVREECLAEGFRVDGSDPMQGKDSIWGGLLFEERKDLRARLVRGELWSA